MKLIVKRSTGLLHYLIVVHLLAGILVLVLAMHTLISAFFLSLILLSLTLNCQRYGWLRHAPVVGELVCDDDGRWFLNSEHSPAIVWHLARSVILGPLIFLSFSSEAKRIKQSVLLARDAVDEESWRQLCLKLRDPATWD
jgi:hypothetical protein